MKRKMMLAACMMAVAALSMSIGALAAAKLEKITAYLNRDIKFTVNGAAWTPKDAQGSRLYPITYNNTTYLPIRAVSEAAGIRIHWDDKTGTISLDTAPYPSQGTRRPPDVTSEVGYSRAQPAPIGTEVPFWLEDPFLGKVTGSLKVEEVVRGDAAWKAIFEANPVNDKPEQGHEYLLAKITLKVGSIGKAGAQYAVDSYRFKLVSSSGKDYDYPIVNVPDPQMLAYLYAGASHTGWVAFQVSTDDPNPLMAFERQYDGTGGLWFKTK